MSELKCHATYIFNQGMFKLDCGLKYSWHYFKNYHQEGVLELYPKVDGVWFDSYQGYPSIVILSDEQKAILVGDVDEFVLTDEYKELQKSVDFSFLPPEDLF